jgi:hypothetical protein
MIEVPEEESNAKFENLFPTILDAIPLLFEEENSIQERVNDFIVSALVILYEVGKLDKVEEFPYNE